MAELSGKRDKSEAPCNDDRLTFVQSRNSGVYLRLQASYVGKADLNGLALVSDDRLTFVQSRNSGVYLRLQASYVGKADLNGLALVSGQSCRSGSPDGGVFAPRV